MEGRWTKKRYTPGQIIAKLWEAEIALSKAQAVGKVVRKLGIAEQTYYRWRKEYGALHLGQAKRAMCLYRDVSPNVSASQRHAAVVNSSAR